MHPKAMIILIDGAVADYLSPTAAPLLHQLVTTTRGFYRPVTGQFPTVTNVNHARILTGATPAENGINGNGFYDRATGTATFIESADFLTAPTLFTKLQQTGHTSALLTVKGKIDQVFGHDATYRINAEQPDAALLKTIGAPLPPDISSLHSGAWVVATARDLIATKSPDFVYATTNDYVMHHYAPDSPEANEFIALIDTQIAAIHALEPERTIYVTADHGMNPKPTLINLEKLLARHALSAHILLPLADRYLKNHQYQESGSAYLYADDHDLPRIQAVLARTAGIQTVLTRAEACARYQLDPTRIGDLVAIATPDTAFGLQPAELLTDYQGRSHGSLAELTVPLFCLAPAPDDQTDYHTTSDIFDHLQTRFNF